MNYYIKLADEFSGNAFSFVQKVPPQNKAEKRQQKSQKKSQKTSNQMTLKSNKTPEIIKKVEIK